MSHGTYAGIDLHASTNYIEMIAEHDRRPYAKRLPNRLRAVLSALGPFEDSLAGVVLESTFN
jgi:transposase